MSDASGSSPTARLLGKGAKWVHIAEATLAEAEWALIVEHPPHVNRLPLAFDSDPVPPWKWRKR